MNLKAQQEFYARNDRRRIIRREHTLEEESPEDVRQRNRKEAEILAANLGEGGINASEIISDMNLLKELAQLQESMVRMMILHTFIVVQGDTLEADAFETNNT